MINRKSFVVLSVFMAFQAWADVDCHGEKAMACVDVGFSNFPHGYGKIVEVVARDQQGNLAYNDLLCLTRNAYFAIDQGDLTRSQSLGMFPQYGHNKVSFYQCKDALCLRGDRPGGETKFLGSYEFSVDDNRIATPSRFFLHLDGDYGVTCAPSLYPLGSWSDHISMWPIIFDGNNGS